MSAIPNKMPNSSELTNEATSKVAKMINARRCLEALVVGDSCLDLESGGTSLILRKGVEMRVKWFNLTGGRSLGYLSNEHAIGEDMPDDPKSSHGEEKFSNLVSINNIVEKICGIRETNHIMDTLISELVIRTNSDQGVISLITYAGPDSLATVVRVNDDRKNDVSHKLINQLMGWILKNKMMLKIDDLDKDARFLGMDSQGGRFKYLLCYPMIVRGEIIGITVLIRSEKKRPYEDDHCRMMGILVPQTAQILSNAKLLEELTRANELLDISRKKLKEENLLLKCELEAKFSFENIIGKSPGMKKVFVQISKFCASNSPVLISGETGTGKDLIARAIHCNSDRKHGPFVVINCGLKTETLLESELFGHIKGSFTGAIRNKVGLFKEADGGTIFLDEIGDAPLSVQVAILRVIQSGEMMPLGATKTVTVDVRVISATNANLKERMAAKTFREDLFYRLNTFIIELPPLRERREDIPLLACHFIDKAKIKLGKERLSISPEALDILMKYKWPGNVRELESEVERASVTCSMDGIILPKDLSPHLLALGAGDIINDAGLGPLKDMVENLEKQMIVRALVESRGNILQASRVLDLTYKGLSNKIKRYNIVLDFRKILSD